MRRDTKISKLNKTTGNSTQLHCYHMFLATGCPVPVCFSQPVAPFLPSFLPPNHDFKLLSATLTNTPQPKIQQYQHLPIFDLPNDQHSPPFPKCPPPTPVNLAANDHPLNLPASQHPLPTDQINDNPPRNTSLSPTSNTSPPAQPGLTLRQPSQH